MTKSKVRGREASVSAKSRPKVHLPARSVLCLPEILSQPLAQCATRAGLLMTDASHRIDKPAPQSVALYLPPLSHTGRPPSAHMVFSLFCRQHHVVVLAKTRLFHGENLESIVKWGSEAVLIWQIPGLILGPLSQSLNQT